MTADSTPVFALEKEALKTEIETGLQVGVDHLEDKPMKRKPMEKYHNTRPVSYTHLDVYKRQRLPCLQRNGLR